MKSNNDTMPRIAVVILNWNGERLLSEFLPSVVRNTPRSLGRVVVVDNGSTDGSVEMLKTNFPDVDLMLFDKNYGFAEGYNKAIYQITEPYTLLLNSDVEVTEGWLEHLVGFMDSHSEVGACQPKIRSYRNKESFEYAGACGGFIDINGYPYCRGRIFDTLEHDDGQYDQPLTNLFWATGAALTVRTALYKRAGGLDARFFAHMEEIDLCWRIQLLGYKIAVVPQSVVYHLGGGSLDASNPKKTYLNFRNNLLMLHKNLPLRHRRAFLLRRRLLDTVAWVKFVVLGQWGNAAAVWRAHRDYVRMRGYYPDVDHADMIGAHMPRNILVEYYLRDHKHFSQL